MAEGKEENDFSKEGILVCVIRLPIQSASLSTERRRKDRGRIPEEAERVAAKFDSCDAIFTGQLRFASVA